MHTTESVDGSRPRPNAGYQVAPPVVDAYGPWVAALDDELTPGRYEWVLVADALVPVALAGDEAQVRPKRRRWSRRTQ
jgi:hypothetical protein